MVRPRKVRAEAPKDDMEAVLEQIEAAEFKRAGFDSDGEQDSPLQAGEGLEKLHASARDAANSDVHADRRVMGAAATVCGAAGMIMIGPMSGVTLGAAALYTATREDAAGVLARKLGTSYLQVSDLAVDAGLQGVDHGLKKASGALEKGCQRLSREVDVSSLPAPVRTSVCSLLNGQAKPALSTGAASDEAKKIRDKYPNKVPVLCERSPYSPDLPEMSKRKFILPGSMMCGEFKYMVHKQIAKALVSPEQTIYIFVRGFAPKTNTPMSELYDRFRAEDGFLYIKYGAENTLG